jgi:hypothetical protein
MAFTNTCGVYNSSPYCVCTDYYGNILPEYKYFDQTTQTYSCCDELVNYATLTNPDTIEDSGTNLLDFAKASNSACAAGFYTNNKIQTNGDLKDYPLIYYQAALNGGLFKNFTQPTFVTNNGNTVRCTSGIPYVVSYPNYNNTQTNYKVLCGSSSTSSLENFKFANSSKVDIPYTINYILDEDGKNCLTNECTPKYNIQTLNEYNIGDRVYKSKGTINSDSMLLKWWFWFVLLFVILLCGVFIYFLYYHGMNDYFNKAAKYLNQIKKGLGDTAKQHAKKNLKAHFHINT